MRILSVIAVCLLGGSFALANPTPSTVAQQASATRAFDDWTIDHLRRTHIPGVAVIYTEGNEVALAKGYGVQSNGAHVTADTKMYVASVSKSFTALAVMQLVEAGQITLDSPVRKYLPEFVLADPRVERITVRQLLEQASGMSDKEFLEWRTPGPESLRDAVARLRTAKLHCDPGSEFHYHNPNYHVAARMVEVVSGESFADYLRSHIFVPLGMKDTVTVDRINELHGQVAKGHIYAFGRAFALAPPAYFENGAAGVVTTANDLSKWIIAQSNEGLAANGTRILSAAGIAQMHKPSAPGGAYGLGWMINRDTPGRIFHPGWLPTFTAFQLIDVRAHTGVAVLSNGGMTMGTGYEARHFADALLAIRRGEKPVLFGESALVLDCALALLAIAVVALSMVAATRSPRWAANRADDTLPIVVVTFAPYLLILMMAVNVPSMAGSYFGNRAATWLWLCYFSPPLVFAAGATIVSVGLVIAFRSIALLRSRSLRPGWRIADSGWSE